MNKKEKIDNKFFDILAMFLSFILSFYRSFRLLFTKNKIFKKNNTFFTTLEFIFQTWTIEHVEKKGDQNYY